VLFGIPTAASRAMNTTEMNTPEADSSIVTARAHDDRATMSPNPTVVIEEIEK
jgi:hypothetical protein